MGCDIHMYLETVDSSDWPRSIAKFNLGRNYTIFSLMAGVRSHENKRIIYQARGLPENIGWMAEYDNELYVVDGDTSEDRHVSRETALGWISRGVSRWTNDSKKWVTHPDYHSHSWLTADELDRVKEVYESALFPRSSWYQDTPEINRKSYLMPEGVTSNDITVTEVSTYTSYPYLVEIGPMSKSPFPAEYEALLAAMKALGESSRVVFWFDN